MEVTVVPVLEAEEPDSSIFAWTDNIRDNSPEVGLFRHAFPFSRFSARSRETYVTSPGSDGSHRTVGTGARARSPADHGRGPGLLVRGGCQRQRVREGKSRASKSGSAWARPGTPNLRTRWVTTSV